MYADIIIDITHEKLDKVFQYSIPSHLEGMLKVGTEVVVPFGRGNKETKGYVTGFSREAGYDVAKIKPVAGIVKDSVAIESKLVALAAWMKEYYGGTMIQALKTVIPIKRTERVKEKRRIRLLLDEEAGKRRWMSTFIRTKKPEPGFWRLYWMSRSRVRTFDQEC